jgi:hypothetical protein
MSGTPTTPGHFTFTLQGSVSGNPPSVGTAVVTIDVADVPKLQFNPLPDATTGVAYDAPYTQTGGVGGQGVWINGTWPIGLGWNNGHVQGITTEDGTFTGTVTPYSNYNYSGTPIPYSLVVHLGPIVVHGLSSAKVGQIYDALLTASGGRKPSYANYTWAFASGTLPPGITLNNDWLHGIPTQSGTFTFDVFVTDAAQTVRATVTCIVQP